MVGSSPTIYRLPRSHWHCTLDNFQWEAVQPASLQSRLAEFVAQATAGAAPHLVLTGPPGAGKTHLGVGTYRAVSAVYGTGVVTWLHVPTFCDAVKATYDHAEYDPWADVEAALQLVVLDDLFGRELTPHEKQILTRLIGTAEHNHAALLATTNLEVQELTVLLLPHEQSRLLDHAVVIPMLAGDWRLGRD